MKKLISFLLSSISLLFASCGNEIDSVQEFNGPNSSTTPTTWQEQLEYAKNNNRAKTRADNNGIYLIEYTHIGKINNNTEVYEIVKQLFSENSMTVQYTDSLNFKIIPIKEIMQSAENLGINDPFESTKKQLKAAIQVGMELIELKWSYNDNIYFSTAIVSNDHGGIMYDNIGFMILDPTSYKSNRNEIESNIATIKTRSETEGTVTKSFTESDSRTNFYGITVWEYSISCFSFFNADKILYDRNVNAYRSAAAGYSCAAEIRTIGGEIDASKFHEFAYGYAYGAGVSVSLKWEEVGFTMSGGGTGKTATEIHRAD